VPPPILLLGDTANGEHLNHTPQKQQKYTTIQKNFQKHRHTFANVTFTTIQTKEEKQCIQSDADLLLEV
jgi:hypothetical protein